MKPAPLLRKLIVLFILIAVSLLISRFTPQNNSNSSEHRGPVQAKIATEGRESTAKVSPRINDDNSVLPKEARETVARILAGGPFPYERDGIVFQNRENRLPNRPRGYYHEYTVITPGSSDRGARRIIRGNGGELYYTEDHYQSFQKIGSK